jgi:radical SAM superfamily enzyme YgiQ (UPF0313 family)
MYETFLAGRIEQALGINVKVITVFDWQNPDFLLKNIETEHDLIIFWEYFTTKAPSYLHKYFETAHFLKTRRKNTLLLGGFWATTHGRYFEEFQIFDHLFEGYSIDRVVEEIEQHNGAFPRHIDVRGPLDWDEYDLSVEYLHDKNAFFQHNTFYGYLSSFSCPRNCSFCFANSARNYGSRFSARSVAKVKEDIDLIIHEYPRIKRIVIKDLNFFYNKKRAFEILSYIKEKGLRTAVNVDVTIYDIDETFVDNLNTLGIVPDLYFGLESFVEETRRKLGKPFTTDHLERTFEMMNRHGISLTGNIILGLPWQRRNEVEEAIRKALCYMRKYRNVYIAMNVYKPEYGSDLQKEYFPDLHRKLSFQDLIEIYKNNVSKYRAVLYGDNFNSIDLEKVHNCIRVVMNAKRAQNYSNSKLRKRALEFMRSLYERQLREPYFRNKIISRSLKKKTVDVITRFMLSPLATDTAPTLFKKAVRRISQP